MTLKECYIALGGDFADVVGRLRSEQAVQKFMLKFLDDGTFDVLCGALEADNLEEAFRAAHTLKGLCLTLGFTKLAGSGSRLTEALRGGDLAAGKALFPTVEEDYRQTVDAILKFKSDLS